MQKNKSTRLHVCPTSKWTFKMIYTAKLLKQILSFGCDVIQYWHISTDVSEFLLPPALGWKNKLNGQRTAVLQDKLQFRQNKCGQCNMTMVLWP
jgi:hypothetical protein